MIDNDRIKGIIGHFREEGGNVRVRDIAYTLLAEMFADAKTAYQCLFGGDSDGYEEYSSDPMRDALRDYLVDDGCIRSVSADADEVGITFEENKREMERQHQERQIIVEKKFDFVCPHTRRECYQLDKEYAMKKWNLIENTQNDGRQ